MAIKNHNIKMRNLTKYSILKYETKTVPFIFKKSIRINIRTCDKISKIVVFKHFCTLQNVLKLYNLTEKL